MKLSWETGEAVEYPFGKLLKGIHKKGVRPNLLQWSEKEVPKDWPREKVNSYLYRLKSIVTFSGKIEEVR
jgi:hypothetical protein